jgi:hypothetical protein
MAPNVITTQEGIASDTTSSSAEATYLSHILTLVDKHKLVCDRRNTTSDAQKVVEFVQPAELSKRLGGLGIDSQPLPRRDLDDLAERVVKYSVKTCSPRFHNQVSL